MNQEVKKLWLAALRSGEYPQACGTLRTTEGYCCLGGLKDIYCKQNNLNWDAVDPDQYCVLPAVVYKWADTSSNPQVEGLPIANHNDGINGVTRKSFNQIADLIETHL